LNGGSSHVPTKEGGVPAYRCHKARNLGVVTIEGRDHYLGPFGTSASKQKYAGLIRAWQERAAKGAEPAPEPLPANGQATVNDLTLLFPKHVSAYYKPNRGENTEAGCISDALAIVRECGYGREPADEFRPKDLKRVRKAMVAKKWCRGYINHQIARVKRMFAFGAEEDLISGSVYHALLAVKGLRRGSPGVVEKARVRPVPIADFKAVLEKASPTVKAMLKFAFYTGARPGEICALQLRHIDRSRKVWVYAVPPGANKNEHRDQSREVLIGPRT